MKALRLQEVQAIVQRDDFVKWWQELSDIESKVGELTERHEELLAQATLTDFRAEFTQKNAIDTLYQAGELEDSAALMLAESAEIENKAYEAVANFENQRITVSDYYFQMGAVEHNLLSAQTEVEEIEEKLRQAGDAEQTKDLERQLQRKKDAAERLDQRLREASAAYERGNERKMSMWEEVEQMWARSLDVSLGVSERRAKGRRARKRAERLFREAEQHKQAAENLTGEADETSGQIEQLRDTIEQKRVSARSAFSCIVGEEFLYWSRRENNKEAYCLPLSDQSTGFNIELEARSLYLVDRQRGVDFIEPLPPDARTPEADDRRIDGFFGGDSEAGDKKEPAGDD